MYTPDLDSNPHSATWRLSGLRRITWSLRASVFSSGKWGHLASARAQVMGGHMGSLFWPLRNQTLQKAWVWTLPHSEQLAQPRCELGGRGGPASWWIEPPPLRAWVLTLAGTPAVTPPTFQSRV